MYIRAYLYFLPFYCFGITSIIVYWSIELCFGCCDTEMSPFAEQIKEF